jgi:hypothetical protein
MPESMCVRLPPPKNREAPNPLSRHSLAPFLPAYHQFPCPKFACLSPPLPSILPGERWRASPGSRLVFGVQAECCFGETGSETGKRGRVSLVSICRVVRPYTGRDGGVLGGRADVTWIPIPDALLRRGLLPDPFAEGSANLGAPVDSVPQARSARLAESKTT